MVERDAEPMAREGSGGSSRPLLGEDDMLRDQRGMDTELPRQFSQGMIVLSLKGHDRGRLYLVLAQKGGTRLLLADGRTRGYVDAKPKNTKHVRPLGQAIDAKQLEDLLSGEMCERERDTFIRNLISVWAGEKGIATR
ncbi:MAG TPA: hypothetical protein VFD19_01490 [Clostridia bacterium]|nr:hypothetical protein [Clostridia bacterium]